MKLKYNFKKICKPCYLILYSKSNEHKTLKRTAGFIYGFFLGLMFYELILVDLNLTQFVTLFVGLIICLMLSFGIAFSSQIRCLALLALPNFSGQAGRGVLKSLVFAYLLSGPIENLTVNGQEVVRVFGCTTYLTFNLTKTRFELMFKPFADALMSLKGDANEIQDTLRSIRDVSAPIAGELEGEEEMKKIKEENDYIDKVLEDTKRSDELDKKYRTMGEEIEAKRYEQDYMKKIEMRCQDQFTRAATKCRKGFRKAYDVCYDTVSFLAAWLLCWPMKLTFVCNIAEAMGGAGRCDPSKHVEEGFGQGYEYLKHSRQTLSENFKKVKLQYKMNPILQVVDVRSAADTAKAVIHEVTTRKDLLLEVLIIFKRLLAFIFLRILISSQKYHDLYLRDIEYDNFYVTKYFRHIDARRMANGKHTLLPLKKIERQKLVDPTSLKPIKIERQEITSQIFKLCLEVVTATTIVLLDRLFYEALDLVRRHAKVDFYQTGHHDMKLEIKGTGMIANLLKSVVRGFNIKKRIKSVRSNATCLPNPRLISHYYLFKIYGTFILILISILVQAYTLRLRRAICAYFYRKREKKRILFLYNETYKRRIGFLRHMKRHVKKISREQRLEKQLNLCAVLRVRYPHRFDWLRIFPAARQHCVICGEPEPRVPSGIPGDFERCKQTPSCQAVHCVECWNDIGRLCLACSDETTDSEGEAIDSDDDDDDDYKDKSTKRSLGNGHGKPE